jgi:hypothetical protein
MLYNIEMAKGILKYDLEARIWVQKEWEW